MINISLKIRTCGNYHMFEIARRNPPKIPNSENNPKSKTSKFEISKTWSERRENILIIIIQTRLFLHLNIIIRRVLYSFEINVLLLTVI